ncbi:hypothetical protein [Oleomonas cavernae]|uniref:hypothetical protein n=1 Tax=Oleomonas cavernae TaxID=2320859 RepID=UPI0011C3C80D|nr:hypothetical protein [Oleomonas cavernae]
MNAQSQVISLDEYRARRAAKPAAAAAARPALEGQSMPVFFCWVPVWFFVPLSQGTVAPSW